MTMIGLGPLRKIRNGARASKWVATQLYNVEAASKDESTPVNVMMDIALNGTSRVIGFLAGNKAITVDVIKTIMYDEPSFAILSKLASNPVTPSDVLAEIASGAYVHVQTKRKVLKHRNAPFEVLEAHLPKTSYETITTNFPSLANKWRGNRNHFASVDEQIVMLRDDLPIDLFVDSLPYVSHHASAYELYRLRGHEFVDYLNSTFNLSIDYSDTAQIVRAVKKHLL